MGSNVLSNHCSGFLIFVYLAASFITVIIAIGTLSLDKEVYDKVCSATQICISFTYALPAIATTFSILTFILALIQTRLYHTRAITGILVFIFNVFTTILWLIVIVIGWSPISASVDTSTRNVTVSVTGWFLWIRDAYNVYQDLNSPGYFDSEVINLMNFSFGLLVLTHMIFTMSVIMAAIGLIVHIQDPSDRKSMSNLCASTKGNIKKGPWVRPRGIAEQGAEEPMSSV